MAANEFARIAATRRGAGHGMVEALMSFLPRMLCACVPTFGERTDVPVRKSEVDCRRTKTVKKDHAGGAAH